MWMTMLQLRVNSSLGTCTFRHLVTSHPYHQGTTWLYDSFVSGKTRVLFQPRDLRLGISSNLALKWGYVGFINHGGRWRWYDRRSWDGFTRIALWTLRARIALTAWRSLRPGWTSFTRPPSSSPGVFWATYFTGQVTKNTLHFFLDFITTDHFAVIWSLVRTPYVTFLTSVFLCKRFWLSMIG